MTAKILHIYKCSFPDSMGGVEVFIDSLCRETSKMGCENTVFALSKTPSVVPIEMDGYRVVQGRENFSLASTPFSFTAFFAYRKLVKEHDIIHYHFPNPFADLLNFFVPKKPMLLSYHSDIVKQKFLLRLYAPLMHKTLSASKKIIAASKNYVRTSKALDLCRDKVQVIPYGLDSSLIPEINPDRLSFWKQKLPPRFFLFVGALRYYKGLHVAIKAMSECNYHLVIAGSGGIEQQLKEQVLEAGLNNVHFVGSISEEDKVILHSLSDAFLFPSHLRSEAFGVSLIEALQHGKPIISCEIGTGTSFVNSHQETGLVVKPDSSAALVSAMQFLVENPTLCKEYSVNAKKRYLALFTAKRQAQEYCRVYEALLGIA